LANKIYKGVVRGSDNPFPIFDAEINKKAVGRNQVFTLDSH